MNTKAATFFLALLFTAGMLGCSSEPPPAAIEEAPAASPGFKAPPAQPRQRAAPKADQRAGADQQAPEEFTVKLETTKGEVLIDVHPSWAPLGAKRFRTLVEASYFDDAAFFRVLDGFMAQTGLNANPAQTKKWRNRRIQDDPVTQSNQRGTVSFATSGRDSRTTQFFINYGDNSKLDRMGFSPFGKVRDMSAVDQLYSGYGEGFPNGKGPSQQKINMQGNAYLKAEFPKLDYIKSARIVK
jgi:peptidyl-prolyl cis-trans isomerase A (cyclophilin A)